MSKQAWTEQEIRTRVITPAIQAAGWAAGQIREEYVFTDGRIIVRGRRTKRGRRRKIDYLLEYKPNLPLAIVEAKVQAKGVGGGMQQALDYAAALQTAKDLDVPFVYSSNGQAFLEHDRTGAGGVVERELPLDAFPSPAELWQRYKQSQAIDAAIEPLMTQDYYYAPGAKTPRYYQRVAINRVVEGIARGQKRLLLVMATGTGKTLVAAQVIWRLWRQKKAKRVLFLADRNILIDQAQNNDFKHFGDAMHKISERKIDKAYEIYLALYQAISGTEERQNIYREFSPNFFDLIVVDECHRGSAAEDSAWREILTYFAPAAQLGMTATPKETAHVSNIDYFGEPVYTYSLRQGIEDGFLAPYRVIRIQMDKDLDGWQPEAGQVDRYGNEIPFKRYAWDDMEWELIIGERTKLVAGRIAEFLQGSDPMGKTIVFCVDIDHAERMRQALVNANMKMVAQDSRYVVRITGDSEEGKRELENFIAPDEAYPVIATTSKLLTTGVDVQTCKLIVLDRQINSMTEFKQIIGRGTRIEEAYNKRYFTIMDFRDATRLFADPDFDGEPVQVIDIGQGEDMETAVGGEGQPAPIDGSLPVQQSRLKYYVDDVPVAIRHEWQQFMTEDGRLVTEKFVAFSRDNLRQVYHSLGEFLRQWSAAERKEAILAELLQRGVWLDRLEEEFGEVYDPFDLICHIAFDLPALTRQERARRARAGLDFSRYGEVGRQVLETLLDKYAETGIEALEQAADAQTMAQFLYVPPFNKLGTPIQIIKQEFGGQQEYAAAIQALSQQLYEVRQ